MGRSRGSANLLPLERSAEILGVNPQTVLAWANRGVLEQVWIGQDSYYRQDQVSGLAPLVATTGQVDLGTVAARADLAYVTSRNVEVRLNALLDMLGLNRNQIDMRKFAVLELWKRVEDALLESDPLDVEGVRFWAGTFFAIDEAYLLLVEEYVGTDEPWKKFLDLGYKLVVDIPYESFADAPDLRAAYGYLKAARAQLRTVSYFYCRKRHGAQLTTRIFEHKGAITDRIIGLLFPH